MRRAAVPFAMILSASALSCSKPPRTAVDVDTMREASFVNDEQKPPPAAAKTEEPPDEAPIPAATGPTPLPTKTGGNLPEPEIISKKIDKDEGKDKPGKKPSGREKITAAECSKMFDRFFDLLLESDERFKDLGPDAKTMVRQISAQDQRFQSLQKDCESDVSRTKYNCAMSSKTQAAWQTCVK